MQPMKMTAAVLMLALCMCPVIAGDWPRWRGPNLNGISDETGWLDQWPKDGPPVAWKNAVGTGYSSVAVSQGRLYTMGNKDDRDAIFCVDAITGQGVWTHSYPADLGDLNFEGGPTATPTVDGDRVYTLSRWGDVFCLEAATGKVLWSSNVLKETGARVPNWGLSGSPLVHGKLLLLSVGKAGLALEKDTGKIAWKSDTDEAGYSTPLRFQRGGDWYVLVSSGTSFTAVRIETGQPLWQLRWITRYGVNAADPIVAGDHVFLSSGYTKGATLLKMGAGDPTEVWRNRNMCNQFNPSVLLDGFIYGIDGDTTGEPGLRCIELKTGEVRWTESAVGMGSVMAADGKLIVLSERGELMVAKASPEGFKPSARARVLAETCWTVPVLANGRIYCRNSGGDLVCLDVRGKK
jgi:outer membrane protein assembly factor BamB